MNKPLVKEDKIYNIFNDEKQYDFENLSPKAKKLIEQLRKSLL